MQYVRVSSGLRRQADHSDLRGRLPYFAERSAVDEPDQAAALRRVQEEGLGTGQTAVEIRALYFQRIETKVIF